MKEKDNLITISPNDYINLRNLKGMIKVFQEYDIPYTKEEIKYKELLRLSLT